ncbi:hypothetical protein BW721_10490 [Jeotgalibaca sp. PTS2502]|uniref:5' nucleotidase, NT5C type n=1 Tax=Jeotgalibaca sp. PTS2502 TaxID=1903686 RepID=UPI000973A45F|nr:hypothetical protein [Jeotgalibaca sp. PTS2502]APZ50019.1 hypothetical protein BW721_10490 [Jeotgalibaca sp. PTS2502]
MGKRLSIAIDMDDVLCQTTERLIERFNAHFQQQLSADDLGHMMKKSELPKEMIQFVLGEFNQPGFARKLEVKENAVEVVRALNDQYDVYIATAAMEVPGTFTDKFHWLEDHFPFLDPHYFIFCGNKEVVRADYLIDDTVKQLHQFKGTGILYTAHFNRGLETPFKRVDQWSDVYDHFIKQFDERLTERAKFN